MNKYKLRKFSPAIIAAILLVAIFLGGFYFGRNNGQAKGLQAGDPIAYSQEAKKFIFTDKDEVFDFNLYWEVWDSLKQNHVSKNRLKDKDLFYGSLKGLAEATGDPYTVFLDPQETEEFYNDLSGTFEGIGAEVGIRNDVVTVIAPLDGMPAQKAGLQAGDKIYAINNESALGLSLYDAVKKIRGPKGSDVTLTIIRGDHTPQDIVVTRGIIVVKSVKTELRDDNIYVIKITNFNDDTLDLFNKAVKSALLSDPDGIILDLRNNPGGYLDMAISVASEWVEAGPIVAEQFGENRRNEHPSNGKARLKDFPTIVLVNQGSASASEIVAGALRDYKKATLVGMTTFGKGSVQSVRGLSDGSALKVTVAKWLTPAGDFIDEKGLSPDIEVDMSSDDIDNDRDPQFDKAIELLKNK